MSLFALRYKAIINFSRCYDLLSIFSSLIYDFLEVVSIITFLNTWDDWQKMCKTDCTSKRRGRAIR